MTSFHKTRKSTGWEGNVDVVDVVADVAVVVYRL